MRHSGVRSSHSHNHKVLKMKSILIITISFVFLFVPTIIFAEEYTVVISARATSPDCIDNDTCIIPRILYIDVGDTVHFDAHRDNGVMIFCYGTSETGCIQAGDLPIQLGSIGSRTYSEKGIFDYWDRVHPWLEGRIIVGLDDSSEQNLDEIKEKQEKNIEDYLEMTDLDMSERLQLIIDDLKEKNDSLNQKIHDMKFENLQLQTINEKLKNQLESNVIEDKDIIYEMIHKSITTKIAPFVDPDKDPQDYVDRYNNESSYKKWFDSNYPEYDSIEQAVGLELTRNIPDWIKNIFVWYGQDQIEEDELLNAIKFLINKEIINIVD